MLFSVEWLRALRPFDADAAAIAGLLTARGLTVDAVLESEDGAVLDVDVPANRPDCLGHLGLAREIAAGLRLDPPRVLPASTPADGVAREVAVAVDDPALCPRYTAGVCLGIRVAPSPASVVRRLAACGVRSINNVVDASNWVLLELGQPVHFFDADRLPRDGAGRRVVRVRRARDGETLETLDGVTRSLDPEVLVIADAERAIALAGILGGRATEIVDTTRNVLVEAACFDPRIVRSAARRLAVHTDASHRFERGVDRNGPLAAQVLSLRLLAELAGGAPVAGFVDVHPARPEERKRALRFERVHGLLGYAPGADEVVAALDAVGLRPERNANGVEVTVPSWRLDLEREADLVEEVARDLGYGRIPSPAADDVRAAVEPPEIEERCRDILAAHGFHEGIGYSMIGADEDDRYVAAGAGAPFALRNPIAEPLAVLRRSILPALVRMADTNFRRGAEDVRLFEVGRVFLRERGAGPPSEPARVGLVWSGAARPRHWSEPLREVDLDDVAGLVELLLEGCRPGLVFDRAPDDLPALHPGSAVHWSVEPAGTLLARAGALHPEIQERLDRRLFLAEIDLARLDAVPLDAAAVRRLSRFPAVTRDLALVLSAEHSFADAVAAMRAVPAPAPVRFEAVDRYVGPPLAAGESSLTVRLVLEPTERTLTDDETEAYRVAVVRRLAEGPGIPTR